LIALVAKARDFQGAYRFETEKMKNQFCFFPFFAGLVAFAR
jgi:hypothetical protein